MSKIKMYWWNEQPNFGDALNPIIISKLFGLTVEWAEIKDASLVGAGSCLQWVASEALKFSHEIHIWGTGYMYDQEPPIIDSNVVHHAVRGRKSSAYGGLSNIVVGDPGILSPLLFDKLISKKYRIGIVPHLWNQDDTELNGLEVDDSGVCIIDVTRPALEVVEQIASCEFIYSSSLHGLIVADSFGIPNQWVEFSKKLFGGTWKFDDYYSVYGVHPQESLRFTAGLVKEKDVALLMKNHDRRSVIDRMQQDLLGAFPRTFTG